MLLSYHTPECLEVGVDEAGVGCLAGPVFAAAVIWPPDLTDTHINDSKKLSPKKREELYDFVISNAIDWSVAQVCPQRIDEINIRNARIEAMHKAIDSLNVLPQHILVDGDAFKPYPEVPHTLVVKGDSKYLCIAAASILAKVSRDRYMRKLHEEIPLYEWDRNKGYPTQGHYANIKEHGITIHHRKSFRLLRQF